MHRFSWESFVTDSLLEEIAQIAAVDASTAKSLRSRIARVFGHVGGLPVVETVPDQGAVERVSRHMLLEAVRQVLHQMGAEPPPLGYGIEESEGGRYTYEVREQPRVPVNSGSRRDLVALPAIGEVIADRIIEDRGLHGRIGDTRELSRRIRGLGEEGAQAIANLVVFDTPEKTVRWSLAGHESIQEALTRLLSLQEHRAPSGRLEAAVGVLESGIASNPHPASREGRVRCWPQGGGQGGGHSADCAVLRGSEYYYRLRDMIDAAATSIDVCMFHIAMPSESHPTRQLLDALADSVHRDVSVRMLVDRDRPQDPYRSSVINRPAQDFAQANGIAFRYDEADRLLHSKYLLIDRTAAVLGSHNWSAGSYFQYDDFSLVLYSSGLVAHLRARFDELWANGTEP